MPVSGTGVVMVQGHLGADSAIWSAVLGVGTGLSAGREYFLDPVAGQLTNAPPTTGVVRRMGIGLTGTIMYVIGNFANDPTSAIDVLSGKVSALSTLVFTSVSTLSTGGVPTHGLQSALNALSNRISLVGAGSVTSNEASAISAQAASALSNALSVLSVTDAALSARVDSVANAVSVLSNQVSAISQRLSLVSVINGVSIEGLQSAFDALSNRISAAVAGVASVTSTELSNFLSQLSVTDAGLSARVDSVAQAISVLSNQVSAVSTKVSAISALLVSVSVASADGVGSIDGLQTCFNRLSNKISLLSLGNVIVFDDINARISAITVLLSTVSVLSVGGIETRGLQSALNALSNRISAVDDALSQRMRYAFVSTPLTLSAGTLEAVGALCLGVSVSTLYEIDAMVMYNTTNAAIKFGINFGTSAESRGIIETPLAGIISTGATQSTVNFAVGRWSPGTLVTTVLSLSAVASGVAFYRGVINTKSTTSAVQVLIGTSTGGGQVIAVKGSYIRLNKITGPF
jgi:hypothetical protein